MPELAGKVALVTGGSRGIGAAVALKLAKEGADVTVTYLSSEDKAKSVVEEIQAAGRRGLHIGADSADASAVTSAIDQTADAFGRFDILVNNAGVYPYGPFGEVSLEELDRTLAVHVRAAFVATQAAVAQMHDGGRVINIGSCFAERVPMPGIALYSMTKTALTGLTKALARELGDRSITVNLVHPGPTDTDMNPADGEEAEEETPRIALGHYGTGADIAATVAHLAGDSGRWITGASIAVDGGYAA